MSRRWVLGFVIIVSKVGSRVSNNSKVGSGIGATSCLHDRQVLHPQTKPYPKASINIVNIVNIVVVQLFGLMYYGKEYKMWTEFPLFYCS